MLSPFLEWNIIFSCLECIRHVSETAERFLRSAEAGVLCHAAEARLSAGERIAAYALSTIAAAEEFYSVGYDVCRIDCDTFSVLVASGLDPTHDGNLSALAEVAVASLSLSSPYCDSDEVSALIFSLSSWSVNRDSETAYSSWVLGV